MASFKGKEDSQKDIHTELTDVCYSYVGKHQACYTITVSCHHHTASKETSMKDFGIFFPIPYHSGKNIVKSANYIVLLLSFKINP
jgi:hypothetical protein